MKFLSNVQSTIYKVYPIQGCTENPGQLHKSDRISDVQFELTCSKDVQAVDFCQDNTTSRTGAYNACGDEMEIKENTSDME